MPFFSSRKEIAQLNSAVILTTLHFVPSIFLHRIMTQVSQNEVKNDNVMAGTVVVSETSNACPST